MMTTIKATCPDCGEVEMTPKDVTLSVYENEDVEGFYEFLCPVCEDVVQKPADKHVRTLLEAAHVDIYVIRVPQEFLETKKGAPINHDDLLDFLIALENM